MTKTSSSGNSSEYELTARLLLKKQLLEHKITYKDLSARLARKGIQESPRTIAQKLMRGRFQMAFFLQCMRAIGVEKVTLQCVPIEEEEDGELVENQ
ncbi:DUF6471 domain-containing protein [Paraburkholderia caribensis]|uniref:DUF6471 domain-containing protein n=1 Tax=Paraburkholderia caribensis TaxID=75105 RepID=UPI0034D2FB02